MKLSVIIPYYQGQNYINKAIDSCIHPDMEIIVVDDFSPDPFAYHGDKPVKVIRLNTNVGQGLARNAGLDAARGEWITFLDQDDEFLINLDVFMRLFPDTAQAVWTQCIYKDLQGNTKVYDEDLSLVHGKFYRKQWLIDHDIRFSPKCRWYEDIYFCNLLLPYLEAHECARMDIPTYVWYQNKDQQTYTEDYNYQHFDCMIKACFDVFIRHYKRGLIDRQQAAAAINAFIGQGRYMLDRHNGDSRYNDNLFLLDNAIRKAQKAGII